MYNYTTLREFLTISARPIRIFWDWCRILAEKKKKDYKSIHFPTRLILTRIPGGAGANKHRRNGWTRRSGAHIGCKHTLPCSADEWKYPHPSCSAGLLQHYAVTHLGPAAASATHTGTNRAGWTAATDTTYTGATFVASAVDMKSLHTSVQMQCFVMPKKFGTECLPTPLYRHLSVFRISQSHSNSC